MNWLCRLIGHKWVTYLKCKRNGQKFMRETIWPACLRCGQESPKSIEQGVNDANELYEYSMRMVRMAAEGIEKTEATNGKA